MSTPLNGLRVHRALPLALHDLTIAHTSEDVVDSFHAADGALVDLTGLQAIAATPHQVIDAALSEISSTDNNMVLRGLDVAGKGLFWPVEIPQEDTNRRLSIMARGVMRMAREPSVSPGAAIVRDRTGRHHTVRITQTTTPENKPPQEDHALVLEVEVTGHASAMRESVIPHIRFVPIAEARQPHYLVLAQSVGNSAYATDVQRLLRPEHPIITNMLTLIEYLEHMVWDADRHGWAWQRRQQGREWSRYQTTATLALQATRTALMTHPSTTMDRIRLLRNLHFQLIRSVENTANESLARWLGNTAGPDPYRLVSSIDFQIRWKGERRPIELTSDFKDIFSDYMFRDEQRDSISGFLYAPINRVGRMTLIDQIGHLKDNQERLKRVNEDHPSTADIIVHIKGAGSATLNRPDQIVDQLSMATGWQPL
ncbi:MAG: hypothetical protein AAFV53_18880 [Myxococcota bacterium]